MRKLRLLHACTGTAASDTPVEANHQKSTNVVHTVGEQPRCIPGLKASLCWLMARLSRCLATVLMFLLALPAFSEVVSPLRRFVECTPDVGRVKLLPEDSLLIMASDGLWDVLLDQQAIDIAEV